MKGSDYAARYWVWQVNSPEDVAWAADQGFHGVGMWPAIRTGDTMAYLFRSPALDAHRAHYFVRPSQQPDAWAIDCGDLLSVIAAAAHARGLKVMANMESVDPYHWEPGRQSWTPDLLRAVLSDLKAGGADRWFSECFGAFSEFFYALAGHAREIGIEFQEGCDPCFGTGGFQSPADFSELYERAGLVSMYFYYLGRDRPHVTAALVQEAALGFGLARGWGYPTALVYPVSNDWGIPPQYWPGVLRALSLIAGLQYRVDDIMVLGLDRDSGAELDVPGTSSWINGYVAKQEAEERPLLNVVIDIGNTDDSAWHGLAVSMDAIGSGAFHSGYDLACSTQPMPDADAYWLYTRGGPAPEAGIRADLAALFDSAKPVFLQCAHGVPGGGDVTPVWRRLIARCGVDPSSEFGVGDLPDTATYRDVAFKYTGYHTKRAQSSRQGATIPLGAVAGVVHARNGDTPLIVGKDSKYLIAGSCIGWQAKHAIGHLLSGYGTSASSNVWGIAGEKVSAMIAIEDTEIELHIPKLSSGSTIHVVQWDKLHRKLSDETLTYQRPLRRPLRQYDLLVVDTV